MQAVIICGGKGTRLKTLIGSKPKALVKFNNKANLKILIDILKKNGIKNFLFLVNNFEYEIKKFLADNYNDNFVIKKDENFLALEDVYLVLKNICKKGF